MAASTVSFGQDVDPVCPCLSLGADRALSISKLDRRCVGHDLPNATNQGTMMTGFGGLWFWEQKTGRKVTEFSSIPCSVHFGALDVFWVNFG